MRLKNVNPILASALVILSASTIAFAQTAPSTAPTEGHHRHGGDSMAQCKAKHGEMRQKFAQELGLSAEQQTRIDVLRADFKTAHKAEFDAKHAQYKELKEMEKNGAKPEDIAAKRAALHQQFGSMKAEHEKLNQQIRAVLTPAQAQKFDAMKAQHHKDWENRKMNHKRDSIEKK